MCYQKIIKHVAGNTLNRSTEKNDEEKGKQQHRREQKITSNDCVAVVANWLTDDIYYSIHEIFVHSHRNRPRLHSKRTTIHLTEETMMQRINATPYTHIFHTSATHSIDFLLPSTEPLGGLQSRNTDFQHGFYFAMRIIQPIYCIRLLIRPDFNIVIFSILNANQWQRSWAC